MFNAALFTIAKGENHLSVHQQMTDQQNVHAHNGVLFRHKKE